MILFTKGLEHLINSNTPKLMAYPWQLTLNKATHPPDKATHSQEGRGWKWMTSASLVFTWTLMLSVKRQEVGVIHNLKRGFQESKSLISLNLNFIYCFAPFLLWQSAAGFWVDEEEET